MFGYNYFERLGYCEECGAAWFVSDNGALAGCSSTSCEFYVSPEELAF